MSKSNAGQIIKRQTMTANIHPNATLIERKQVVQQDDDLDEYLAYASTAALFSTDPVMAPQKPTSTARCTYLGNPFLCPEKRYSFPVVQTLVNRQQVTRELAASSFLETLGTSANMYMFLLPDSECTGLDLRSDAEKEKARINPNGWPNKYYCKSITPNEMNDMRLFYIRNGGITLGEAQQRLSNRANVSMETHIHDLFVYYVNLVTAACRLNVGNTNGTTLANLSIGPTTTFVSDRARVAEFGRSVIVPALTVKALENGTHDSLTVWNELKQSVFSINPLWPPEFSALFFTTIDAWNAWMVINALQTLVPLRQVNGPVLYTDINMTKDEYRKLIEICTTKPFDTTADFYLYPFAWDQVTVPDRFKPFVTLFKRSPYSRYIHDTVMIGKARIMSGSTNVKSRVNMDPDKTDSDADEDVKPHLQQDVETETDDDVKQMMSNVEPARDDEKSDEETDSDADAASIQRKANRILTIKSAKRLVERQKTPAFQLASQQDIQNFQKTPAFQIESLRDFQKWNLYVRAVLQMVDLYSINQMVYPWVVGLYKECRTALANMTNVQQSGRNRSNEIAQLKVYFEIITEMTKVVAQGLILDPTQRPTVLKTADKLWIADAIQRIRMNLTTQVPDQSANKKTAQLPWTSILFKFV